MIKRDLLTITTTGLVILSTASVTLMNTCFTIAYEKKLEESINDISKQISELQDKINKIETQNFPGWDIYEKRFKELEEKVKEFEEVTYTETIEPDIEDDLDPLSVYCKSYENVPDCDTNTYRCMDYRTLTNHASDQWHLQLECRTDPETGIRCYICDGVEYYCVALGSAYTETIGDAFHITLQNGYSFNVVNGDFKVPLGTPNFYGFQDRNYDGENTISVVEFIFDEDVAPKEVLVTGTMSALDQFGGLFGDGGNITDISYIGRVWYGQI